MKTEDERRKAEEKMAFGALLIAVDCQRIACRLFRLSLLSFAFCLIAASSVFAQKKPKPALSVKAARNVIAAAPGFRLNTGAIKVKEISPAGASPVSVHAEVSEAFRFVPVEDGRVEQDTGVFKRTRWRAVEFRTGDRSWEEFDFFAAPVGAQRLETARGALEELVSEFAARRGSNKGEANGGGAEKSGGKVEEEGEGKKDKDDKKRSAEPLTRGPLTIRELSAMGSSAVAEITVEAVFNLTKDASGRWNVSEVVFDGGPGVDPSALWPSVNSRKAERARAELATMRDALESYRRERGFYVVAEDSVVLIDHLSPRYIKQIIRLDPWHNPYRYAGTTAGYTLASDGPDGKPGTADDVAISC